jgi:hypothetical protein
VLLIDDYGWWGGAKEPIDEVLRESGEQRQLCCAWPSGRILSRETELQFGDAKPERAPASGRPVIRRPARRGLGRCTPPEFPTSPDLVEHFTRSTGSPGHRRANSGGPDAQPPARAAMPRRARPAYVRRHAGASQAPAWRAGRGPPRDPLLLLHTFPSGTARGHRPVLPSTGLPLPETCGPSTRSTSPTLSGALRHQVRAAVRGRSACPRLPPPGRPVVCDCPAETGPRWTRHCNRDDPEVKWPRVGGGPQHWILSLTGLRRRASVISDSRYELGTSADARRALLRMHLMHNIHLRAPRSGTPDPADVLAAVRAWSSSTASSRSPARSSRTCGAVRGNEQPRVVPNPWTSRPGRMLPAREKQRFAIVPGSETEAPRRRRARVRLVLGRARPRSTSTATAVSVWLERRSPQGVAGSVSCVGTTRRRGLDRDWVPDDQPLRGLPLATRELSHGCPSSAMTSSTAPTSRSPTGSTAIWSTRATRGHGDRSSTPFATRAGRRMSGAALDKAAHSYQAFLRTASRPRQVIADRTGPPSIRSR